MKASFFVPTITSGSCIERLESYIGDLDGVSHVDVSVAKKKVLVKFSSATSTKAIVEAIRDAGYEAMFNAEEDF
ncbi:copper ion binding protein [Helicobacter cetorum]|uniref:Copper iron binding protein n=1 Tax=Helicobacter cetorum (strain ATCC BAA-540 / CCUG 52418 / MIT 99-5656) TaxID=1163745 RepID=I0ETK6_HELCM|nr:copper ion binding protein [Helicobacter cetorum]AFI06275.1 copper iron binding protein [Helicobacter cetorum MIT 99-5656]